MDHKANRNLTRQLSEPDKEKEQEHHAKPAHLTVHGLINSDKHCNFTIGSMGNPSKHELKHTPGKRPDSPQPDDEYKRYLANLSTVTINNGREFRNVPEYLRQFEMSRRGSTVTSDRGRRSRKVSEHEPVVRHASTMTHKPPSRAQRIISAVLCKHRTIGLRHFIFAIVLAIYAVAGMFIFYAIEVPFERKTTYETHEAMNEAFNILAADMEIAAKNPNTNMTDLMKKAYITLIKMDGKYTGSTFFKLEDREFPRWTWDYGTSFFFAFTLYSTVGYGSISPSTESGRIAVIFYTAIGFPATLVILRSIGSALLVHLTKLYAKIVIKYRRARRYHDASNEGIMIPEFIAFLLSVFVVLMTAIFVVQYDAGGPEPGMGLFHAFYFCFLSYAAVGLGDLMPINHVHPALVVIIILCMMPLMRVINRILYVGIENRMYRSVEFVEGSLDRVATNENIEDDRLATISEAAENDGDVLSTHEDLSGGEEDEEENRIRDEQMRNFTIRSTSALPKQDMEQKMQ